MILKVLESIRANEMEETKFKLKERYVLRKFDGENLPGKIPIEIVIIDEIDGLLRIKTLKTQEEIQVFLEEEKRDGSH